ncbi:MAG: hypothetical protein QOE58_155 [Actinomycetota bacterium]|jgi:glycosyltransferase involved in cell wall biosynthesis|nr:hypothetical protein [Actinomycetota bacterium]
MAPSGKRGGLKVGRKMTAGIKKLSVVIPAYNEAATIAEVVRRAGEAEIGGLRREIIVVDDGSTDNTAAIVARLSNVRLISLPQNCGKGRAVKTGFAAATGEIVLIQDGDLEYDPTDYKRILQPFFESDADAVVGSRFAYGRPTFFFGPRRSPFFTHYIGNTLIVRLTNFLYRYRATDYEGGTKAFRSEVISSLPIAADGFEYDNELMCKLLRRGYLIIEVPITYSPRSYADGKKINWKDGARILATIVKWRVKRF